MDPLTLVPGTESTLYSIKRLVFLDNIYIIGISAFFSVTLNYLIFLASLGWVGLAGLLLVN